MKLHQCENGNWIVLDKPETPLYYAEFTCREHAVKAYEIWTKAELKIASLKLELIYKN